MTIAEQLDRLIDVGIAELANLSPTDLAAHAQKLPDEPGAIVAVHPSLVPARQLATLMRHNNKPGFVVTDMIDLEHFVPITVVELVSNPCRPHGC